MKNIEDLTRAEAAHIVQRMGESGQPPERQTLVVNVGTEEILTTLRDEYLRPIREAGRNSSFKLVQAPFGGGKSQFLYCLRELAELEGFCSAIVGVSPKECPFDDAAQIYRAVARSIELPADDDSVLPRPGIDHLLRAVAELRVDEHGKTRFLDWLRNELARSSVESAAMLRAVVGFLAAVVENDPSAEEVLGDYLRGEAVDLSEVARFRLRERPDAETGFRFLRSLAQILRHLELPGLVLLFDEMDRTLSLTRRKKRAIGDNLRQMIDHCGQSVFPAVLVVYAVPPEFMTQVVIEYPALEQRLKRGGDLGPRSPLAPVIDLDRLPLSPSKLFLEIGRKLLVLYQKGYGVDLDAALQERNLAALAKTMGDDALETGSRRSFVKAAVSLLAEQHRGGKKPLAPGEIDALARTVRAEDRAPPPMDGEREI